ncbi:MAG: YggT family protein [Firmicutes bacterium]|nr:YggT family protein [Bacillota bacterium]
MYVISNAVRILLMALQLLMLVRAIMSWIMPDEDNALFNFVYMTTEPVIVPVRFLLDRFEFIRRLPIDISFLVTYILLSVVQSLL